MSGSRSESSLRLVWIDETSRGDHWLLARDDHCLYLGEYLPGRGCSAGALNSLILDFKRTPARIRASPHATAVRRFKAFAIETVARALRHGFGRAAIETALTFVPIPTSTRPDDADYCDRLLCTLGRAFAGWDADVRPLLKHNAASRADHLRQGDRMRRADLKRLMELDDTQLARPLRPIVVLFDDVLTSGKHLSVAKARIRERFPEQAVIAVLVARVSRPSTPVA